MTAVLFDLDGTLLDSFALITSAFRAACRAVLGREATQRELLGRWGQPLHLRFAAISPTHVPELVAAYTESYDASYHELATPFPGVRELLQRLHKEHVALGVVTSKRRRTALRDLESFQLLGFLGTVVASEDVMQVKPAAEPVLRALAELQADAAHTWMVGDGVLDVQAGKAAGVRTIGALWGSRERDALEASQPDYVAASPMDVAAVVYG